MRAKSAAHIVAAAGCLTVELVWALSAFPCTNPAYETVGADSGIFLCMGRGIVQGYTPYVEITENKGPLFFLMMAIPQRIVEGTAGVYVLVVLFALGNCALLMLMARWLMGERRNILCVAACIPVLLRVCGQHLHCEEFNFLFMLLGFAVMIHAYTGQTRGAGARPFLLGLATAAIALIKISDIPGLGVMVLFYIGYAVRARRCLWKDALRYLAGMAVLAVPVLGYLGAVGALGAMFEEYILNNFVHVASAKDAGFWEIRRYLIENGYGWESLKPVLLMAGAVIVRLLIYRGEPERFKREKGLLACAATVAVANMLAAYVSGTGFEQHLAMGDCTLLMACLLALSAVLDRLNRKVRWMKWLEYAAALCVLASVAVPAVNALAPQQREAARTEHEAYVAVQRELLDYLGEDETVYTIGIWPDWYWFADRQPAFRYYNLIGFITDNVGEGLENEFEAFLEQHPIDALFISDDVETYRGILTDKTVEYILNNYQVVSVDSQGRSLWKRNCPKRKELQMRAVIQRVERASVSVEGEIRGQIGAGFLVLIGVEEGDGDADFRYIAEKVPNLRVFEDEQGKMNRSLLDVGGELLAVSQFTLLGDARGGRRPSFITAARPETADPMYERLVADWRARGIRVETGVFGAHMKVSLVNDGPVTILLDSRRRF